MEDQAYQEIFQKLTKRGGRFPGMDIPEFYDLIKELFTPEEAAVFNAIPKDYHPAIAIAGNLGKSEEEVSKKLEAMADKGLVLAGGFGGTFFTVLQRWTISLIFNLCEAPTQTGIRKLLNFTMFIRRQSMQPRVHR